MRVIGTAGHVDHGKSTLVQALTGTHPDRLKEEREREMTIDLGFAFFNLPDGEEVGIVDVPGHRDFIENMLAGVGGIDAALFVIAADEGVMPQTREHLAILDLLQINGGLVALTKTDLAPDAEWIDLVEADIRSELAGTVMEDAPILRVSARTGKGVEAVLAAIARVLAERPKKSDLGRPRLPIDRVFSMPGFGTIVTGTLVDGSLATGVEVEIQPEDLRARVRGLQAHNSKADAIPPGTRTAVNLSGVSVDEIARGGWVMLPDSYPATRRLDLQVRILPDARLPVRHDDEVKFFIGAAEVMGRVRVLGVEALEPGAAGWIQVETAAPVIARRGDRFILRRPSPGETIGGGVVVDPVPKGRHRRFAKRLIERLESLSAGTPEEILAQTLADLGEASVDMLAAASALDQATTLNHLAALRDAGEVFIVDGESDSTSHGAIYASRAFCENLEARLLAALQSYHQRFPLRQGMPREDLRSRVRASPAAYRFVLEKLARAERVHLDRALVAAAGHEVRFNPSQEADVQRQMERFASQPYSPPSLKQVRDDLGDEVLDALLAQGQLVLVSPEVAFRRADYEHMLSVVREMGATPEGLTVASFRDRFKTSRKYALAFLEHLDAIGVTVRVGDGRRLK